MIQTLKTKGGRTLEAEFAERNGEVYVDFFDVTSKGFRYRFSESLVLKTLLANREAIGFFGINLDVRQPEAYSIGPDEAKVLADWLELGL